MYEPRKTWLVAFYMLPALLTIVKNEAVIFFTLNIFLLLHQ